MDAMGAKTGGQSRIVGNQHNQPAGTRQRKNRAGKRGAAGRLAGAQDHQAAARQTKDRGQRIGRARIVSQKGQQPRVEMGGCPC